MAVEAVNTVFVDLVATLVTTHTDGCRRRRLCWQRSKHSAFALE